jgi:hypothetical protein
MLQYLWLLVFFTNIEAICQGSWSLGENSIHLLHIPAARKSLVDNTPIEWLYDACAAQTVQQSCYGHGNIVRAQAIERRQWIPRNTSECLPFYPADYLRLVEGRKVVLVGDSITMGLWSAFACATYQSTSSDLQISWYEVNAKVSAAFYNNKTCPFGAFHCHIQGSGSVRFPLFRSQLIYHSLARYTKGFVHHIVAHHRLQPRDVIVLNWGVHINLGEEHLYPPMLEDFKADLAELKANHSLPLTFFLESFPQHFGGDSGDYGNRSKEQIAQRGIHCFPNLLPDDQVHERDWRNRIAEQHLHNTVPIIKVHYILPKQTHLYITVSDGVWIGGRCVVQPVGCAHRVVKINTVSQSGLQPLVLPVRCNELRHAHHLQLHPDTSPELAAGAS